MESGTQAMEFKIPAGSSRGASCCVIDGRSASYQMGGQAPSCHLETTQYIWETPARHRQAQSVMSCPYASPWMSLGTFPQQALICAQQPGLEAAAPIGSWSHPLLSRAPHHVQRYNS